MPQQFNAQNSATREAEQRNFPGQNASYDHRPHQPQGYGPQQNNSTQSYGIPIRDTTHAAATVVTPVSRDVRKSLGSGNSNKKGPGPNNSSNSKGSGQRDSTSKMGGKEATSSKTGSTNSNPVSNEHSSRKRARRDGSGSSQPEPGTPTRQPNPAPNFGTAHNNSLPNHLSRRAISRAANSIDRSTPTSGAAKAAKSAATKVRRARDIVDRAAERDEAINLALRIADAACPGHAVETANMVNELIARIIAICEDMEECADEGTPERNKDGSSSWCFTCILRLKLTAISRVRSDKIRRNECSAKCCRPLSHKKVKDRVHHISRRRQMKLVSSQHPRPSSCCAVLSMDLHWADV